MLDITQLSRGLVHRTVAIFPTSSFRLVSLFLGLVLLFAAVSKVYQLNTEPLLEAGILSSRWVLVSVVEFEILLGFWLLSGLYANAARYVAICSFVIFSGTSLYLAGTGQSSCGCFGGVSINPWKIAALDVAAVIGLLYFKPQPNIGRSRHSSRAIVAILGVTVGLAVLVLPQALIPSRQLEDGFVAGPGRIMVLRPEQWVGRPFPLLPYVITAQDVSRGNWLILLFHPGCPKCQHVIQHLSEYKLADWPDERVMLVEVPPYSTETEKFNQKDLQYEMGRLEEGWDWFVQTPALLRLANAKVVELLPSEADKPQDRTFEPAGS